MYLTRLSCTLRSREVSLMCILSQLKIKYFSKEWRKKLPVCNGHSEAHPCPVLISPSTHVGMWVCLSWQIGGAMQLILANALWADAFKSLRLWVLVWELQLSFFVCGVFWGFTVLTVPGGTVALKSHLDLRLTPCEWETLCCVKPVNFVGFSYCLSRVIVKPKEMIQVNFPRLSCPSVKHGDRS